MLKCHASCDICCNQLEPFDLSSHILHANNLVILAPTGFTTAMLRPTVCVTTPSVCLRRTPILKLLLKISFRGLIDTNIKWLKAVCTVG